MGAGPPLVMLPGLAPENCRPVGSMRSAELSTMGLYSKRFTVYWTGRPTGLAAGVTFAELTAQIADALRARFAEPVDVIGFSTGGSFGQQLAAEHPDVVRRLVLVSSGCRLAGHAAHTQRAMIDLVARRGPRAGMAAFAWDVVPRWRGRVAAAAFMYAAGLRLYPGARDSSDFLATLIAEAEFDLAQLPTVSTPTLIVNGGRDRFYEADVVAETAQLIPGSQLLVLPKRGHVGTVSDRTTVRTATEFLGIA